MKKVIYIFLIFLSYTAYSQSISFFNLEASKYPKVKAKFYAFDANGNQILDGSPSEFSILENGQPKTITSINCPNHNKPIPLSTVLVIDASGSMTGGWLPVAKAAAKRWVELMPNNNSECAITSFNVGNFINQDFTNDKDKLYKAIESIKPESGTDYDIGLLTPFGGGLAVTKTGTQKRVIVFLTDGEPNKEPKVQEIIDEANRQNCVIYSVVIGFNCPKALENISSGTGGQWFDRIYSADDAKKLYEKILMTAQGSDPCTIEWDSGILCQYQEIDVEINLPALGLTSKLKYTPPENSIAKLIFSPSSLKFLKATKDTCINVRVIANNADFDLSSITISNPAYRINTPMNFVLKSGESRNIDVCYTPLDSGYTFCKFTVDNNYCPAKFYASGGFPGKRSKLRTLKLIQPNGGEEFVVGADTNITWEGVLPDEPVRLEYTTSQGTKWNLITDSATGYNYNWVVPKTPSDKCLARVTAKLGFEAKCPEIQICNQIWMSCNLDVDTYRNGDPIPEVTDPGAWGTLTTGAWCHYDNDQANGETYGKLYNWYAINDIRGLAPEGWHIATDAEWMELENCLGDSSIAGGHLKATGTIEADDGYWYEPNTGATNSTGFSALPGGWRNSTNPKYSDLGLYGYYWTSTPYNDETAYLRLLYYNFSLVFRNYALKQCGFSVRCVRD